MNPSTPEEPTKEPSLLVAAILALVSVHFLFDLVLPFALIYEVKPLLSETAYRVWLCQPVFIAMCLFVARRTPRVGKVLLYVDIGLSVLQHATVYFLYAIADRIG